MADEKTPTAPTVDDAISAAIEAQAPKSTASKTTAADRFRARVEACDKLATGGWVDVALARSLLVREALPMDERQFCEQKQAERDSGRRDNMTAREAGRLQAICLRATGIIESTIQTLQIRPLIPGDNSQE